MIMLPPICECLVLVGIHSYLGIHVIRRGVIFIDLSLAQIAALGTTVGLLFGLQTDTTASFMFSILFTFIGAGIFATTRFRHEHIPQEAVIGLVYALAAALAILVLDRSPAHGAEHLKNIMVGRISWVTWSEVLHAAFAYSIIGVVHYLLRDKFLLISLNPEWAYLKKINVKFWDFIFYLTFGFVISFSVNVAGVLLVFVFLVVPAVAAILITNRLLYQLLIGWAMGTVVSVCGIVVSYFLKLPDGPTVVSCYGLVLLFLVLPLYVFRAKNIPRALVNVATGVVITVVVVFLVYLLGVGLKQTSLARSEMTEDTEHHHEEALEKGQAADDESDVHHDDNEDIDVRFEDAGRSMEEGQQKDALKKLIAIVESEETPMFYREKSMKLIEEITGEKYDYDPALSPEENREPIEKIKKHLDRPPGEAYGKDGEPDE